MKRIFYVLALAAMTACGDAVQKDLINYYNTDLPKVTNLEMEAMTAYEGVAGPNYQGDSIMYMTISQTVIPKYSEFYDKLQAIKPATPEIQKMHGEYVEAAKDQLEAFKLIISAIEKQDPEVIKVANGDFEKAQIALDEWRNEFEALKKQHNVVIEPDSVSSK